MLRRELKALHRQEAEERAASYVPNPERFGLKEKVKAGLLDPVEIERGSVSSKLFNWCSNIGRRRYAKAKKNERGTEAQGHKGRKKRGKKASKTRSSGSSGQSESV